MKLELSIDSRPLNVEIDDVIAGLLAARLGLPPDGDHRGAIGRYLEGTRTEAEGDCLTVLGGGLVWTAVHWLRQGPTREHPDAMAARMARTSATILDAFDLTRGFAQTRSN
ncbi:hypothetical protein R0290_29590 [Burkholderia semiarida]|uniref:hypothetical protein n=1 Tax=Burkholderia TaxID=32008 RepID=UPI00265F32DC|nr:hypothetical protein [Burkholderia sp. AU44665]MDN7702625.1 hypothetical protein [Burkholderia sp. AU44665]